MSLALHYWIGDVHHCSGPPVSEMTYTVSSGTLNSNISNILYHTTGTRPIRVYSDDLATLKGGKQSAQLFADYYTVWQTAVKYGTLSHFWRTACFQGVSHAPSQAGRAPALPGFYDSNIHP